MSGRASPPTSNLESESKPVPKPAVLGWGPDSADPAWSACSRGPPAGRDGTTKLEWSKARLDPLSLVAGADPTREETQEGALEKAAWLRRSAVSDQSDMRLAAPVVPGLVLPDRRRLR